jgi:hypothetical protein
MPDIWRIYHVRKCPHTVPAKDKFVLIVCIDVTPLGFFINTNIHPFILNRPNLLDCQVSIKASDYWFLDHDSYIDCTKLFPFGDDTLIDGRELISEGIKKEIKSVVSTAATIEKRYKKLILDKP